MSTRKNGIKTIPSKSTVPNNSRKRVSEQSTDRSKAKSDNKTTTNKSRVTSKVIVNKKDEEETKRIISNREPPKRTPVQKSNMTVTTIKNRNETKKIITATSSSRNSQKRPVTPPSTRVTKTKFFPSKNMYSHALKNEKIIKNVVKSPRDSGDNSEISTTSTISERPRTATLRKGSIVNDNIAGPEAPPNLKLRIYPQSTKEEKEEEGNDDDDDDNTYADDFDSYESDFEQYNSSDSVTTNGSEISTGSTSSSEQLSGDQLSLTQKRVNSASTDDEKKLDSGNFDLHEFKPKKQILDNIKESTEKENFNINIENNGNNLSSLSDEGFEDAKSLQFINFLGAKKKYEKKKELEKKRKRGEEILSMIKLDSYSFTLLDIQPVPYEEFIKTFGQRNAVQASVQTGDDDLTEETQTDDIITTNKWTQFPSVFTKIDNEEIFWNKYKANYLGVGSDNYSETFANTLHYNQHKLNQFLLKSCNLILNLQAENDKIVMQNLKESVNIPFSNGYVVYETQSIGMLRNRKLIDIYFWNEYGKILTIHSQANNDSRSLICCWGIGNVERPETVFAVFGEITCCSTGLNVSSTIFGGLEDGSIILWDTKENLSHHKGVEEFSEFPTRTPTYTTEINFGHQSKIVSIRSLCSLSSVNNNFFESKASTEICSLDEDGNMVIWGVIIKNRDQKNIVDNEGLAHWGNTILTINTKISLKSLNLEIDDFKCTDLITNVLDPTHLFVSTNHGYIIHCLSNGTKANIKKFRAGDQFRINCLEVCPFSFEYYMAGLNDGTIRFYSQLLERYLIKLSDKDCIAGRSSIEIVQWSRNRPFIFYTKDITNTIHVWNLTVSDMVPTYSIPFKVNIISMKLSDVSDNTNKNEESYMLIADENGLVYLHTLNDEHGSAKHEEYERDKKRFFYYINGMI